MDALDEVLAYYILYKDNRDDLTIEKRIERLEDFVFVYGDFVNLWCPTLKDEYLPDGE